MGSDETRVERHAPPTTEAVRYTVTAYNFAHASENRIHDDTVASSLGFRGGLVPGVAVFAYAAHAALEALGAEFLERGYLSLRFLQPAYDGDRVTAIAIPGEDGSCEVEVLDSGDALCASGRADLTTAVAFERLARHEQPTREARLEPSLDVLKPGLELGTVFEDYGEDRRADLLERYREDAPRYRAPGSPLPPALVTELANRVLAKNVALGPWIHVRSSAELVAPLRAGRFEVRARVAQGQRRGSRERVTLQVQILDHEERTVARLEHEAIVRLS